jgi:hypothetical protein
MLRITSTPWTLGKKRKEPLPGLSEIKGGET